MFAAVTMAACSSGATERRARANAYLRAGDARAAVEECDLGLDVAPDDVGLHVLRGKALFELGHLIPARDAFQRAVDRSGEGAGASFAEAQLGLAIVAARGADWTEARRRFEILVDLDPTNASARINLARACLALDERPCAVEHAEAAAHSRGNDEDVLFTLGRIYTVVRRFDDAEKTFAHICEVLPGAASCPYGAALVAAQRGDLPRALAKLREAVALRVPRPETLPDDALLAPIASTDAFRDLVRQATDR